MEEHHAHHERPLQIDSRIAELHAEVTRDRHPHGPEAELICNCFRAVSQVAAAEVAGVEPNSQRMAEVRALWVARARQFQNHIQAA